MRSYFLGGVLVLISTFCQGQDSLKILSWNIQMLPRGINHNGKAKRAKIIAEQLKYSPYDVVVFQELFYRRSRRIIAKELQSEFPAQTNVLNKKSIALKTNGGVMIFSRHPIEEIKEIRFKNRSGPDRLSRKGAMLAAIDVNGNKVQIIGTHLQAFGMQETMYSQYQQLYDELLKPNEKKGIPQFICGDFNTIKELPKNLPANLPKNFAQRIARYETMLQKLQASDGDLDGEHQFTMDRPNNDLCEKRKEFRLLLDYFLFRPMTSNLFIAKRKVQIIRYPWRTGNQDLSDHFALEAVVNID
jgi:endonuclease/exonuclease/phosphatase family metal-dependent hydrolase